MVLDTSAIIATITNEQDSSRFRAAMLDADSLLISSVAVLETRIVLFARLGPDAVALFEQLLENAGIVVVPFDDEMAKAAFDAFRRFGKGQGNPAQLNIVDCAVYALAKTRSQPLLFKGGDFDRTDIHSALV
ncbi:type II toxin-antitoxin system VapC family toxin [Bradyrhizobium sp. LjRoot220]|uniref:type II toxin-antitoxin system VapC family toxin n=1 Tax=Bradyrhizobium sp. LjRoot220 TaxID=3342284 RepID=UPI003ECF0F48